MPEAKVVEHLECCRRQIEEADVACTTRSWRDFKARLPAVQTVIYLIFNEGYLARMGNELCRPDLCAEAFRLGRGLCELLPRNAESLAYGQKTRSI